MKLSRYQRATLIRQTETWGDAMVKLATDETRSESERTRFGDEAANWYEVARVLATAQGVK